MSVQLKDEFDAFIEALSVSAPISIRLNPFKPTARFADDDTVAWCESGRYLKERPSFTMDPLFHAGCYYVQEASSMFIEQLKCSYAPFGSIRSVLDLCAAPGGKSTHLRSLIPHEALLVANEVVQARNHVLCENLSKWGHSGIVVTRNTPQSLIGARIGFDMVLVDAPCSGEGMFRKDPDAVREWSPEAVASCSIRQKEILDVAVELLNPGGLLVYSTCTWSAEEDEQISDYLVSCSGLQPLLVSAPDGLVRSEVGLRFYPHRIKGEGFYLAAFTKPGTLNSSESGTRPATLPGKKVAPPSFRLHGDFEYRLIKDTVWAYPVRHIGFLQSLQDSFHVVYAGCKVGTPKGVEVHPAQELSQSLDFSPESPAIELSLEDSLRYLRGEALVGHGYDKGYRIVTYQGQSLGWVKAVSGRLNNNYPKERRIRKQF